MSDRLNELLGHPRILVVGDVMLDRYTWGVAERVSPEAPVLVLRVDEKDVRLGGAASVASLLKSLEADVTVAGVVGNDHEGRTIARLFGEAGIDAHTLLFDPTRPTTTKERFLGRSDHRQSHQMLRVDSESREPIPAQLVDTLAEEILAALPRSQAVLISDYAKGVCTERLVSRVIAACQSQKIPVLVDPGRGVDWRLYRGATLIKPNRLEAEQILGTRIRTIDEALIAAMELRKAYELEVVAITLDRDGLVLTTPEGASHHPISPHEVCDITGAGDTALAVLGLGIAARHRSSAGAGLSWESLAALVNTAAGLQVARSGVAPIPRSEWLREFAQSAPDNPSTGKPKRNPLRSSPRQPRKTCRKELSTSSKLLASPRTTLSSTTAPNQARDSADDKPPSKRISLEEARNCARQYHFANRTIVFTNGCFDLLHVGHVSMLEEAARFGDVLIVAINSDESVRGLKGPTRPVITASDRARMIASLACVDHVLIFDEPTPHRLLEAIRPDVLVKGGTTPEIVGREIVEAYGGRIERTGEILDISTTLMITQLRSVNCPSQEHEVI